MIIQDQLLYFNFDKLSHIAFLLQNNLLCIHQVTLFSLNKLNNVKSFILKMEQIVTPSIF